MPKYHVRLESQTDSQARHKTVTADSEDAARVICESQEEALVAFQIADEKHLERLDKALSTDENGKIVGSARGKAKADWHAHHQTLPYVVVSVEEV